MNLIAHYDPEIEAVSLHYDQSTCGGYEVAENWSIILHVLDDDGRKGAELEVIGIGAWLPLGKRNYCHKTDTLTFGDDVAKATIIAENGDLIAYWAPDEYDPSDLVVAAVDLRNASQHLASVIEVMPQAVAAHPG